MSNRPEGYMKKVTGQCSDNISPNSCAMQDDLGFCHSKYRCSLKKPEATQISRRDIVRGTSGFQAFLADTSEYWLNKWCQENCQTGKSLKECQSNGAACNQALSVRRLIRDILWTKVELPLRRTLSLREKLRERFRRVLAKYKLNSNTMRSVLKQINKKRESFGLPSALEVEECTDKEFGFFIGMYERQQQEKFRLSWLQKSR